MADIDVAPAPRRAQALSWAALALALAAAVLLLATGPGMRTGAWDFRTSFALMRWAGRVGAVAALVAVGALVMARGRARTVAGIALLVGAAAFYLPWSWRHNAMKYPPIHDLTTDTHNPPAFVAVVPLRRDAPNPPEYAGDSVAAIQAKAYPDLRPLMLAMTVDSAFTLAAGTAREMGWELVDQDRRSGRIEATASTPWFGFKDDVVIRVTAASGIARVDVRSKSRVGRGDAGVNAKRIRTYVGRLRSHDSAPVRAE